MNKAVQASADLTQVAKMIDGIPIAMLTSMDAAGALVSRPMAALEMDAQGVFWFFTGLRSSKVEHLGAVNLSFTDIAQGTYVSLAGRGEIDTDRGRIQRLWTTFAKAWVADGPDSPDLALLKFVPDAVDYWDGPKHKMVRAFGPVASVVAGKPVLVADDGSHTGLSTPASMGGAA